MDSGRPGVGEGVIFAAMKKEQRILPPRYHSVSQSDNIRSMSAVRRLVGPFSEFVGRSLTVTEEVLIAWLEDQRQRHGRVRAYVIDPRRHYERLLIEYSVYIEAAFGGGGNQVAVLGPTKKTAKLPDGVDRRSLHLFSGRRPDHIRGFGAFRAAVMVCADRTTAHSNRDRAGRRAMQALNSAVPEERDTSLIFIGESYSRWSRLFSIMYRRICGSPFPSDTGAVAMPPSDDILAIDVRLLDPPAADSTPATEEYRNHLTIEDIKKRSENSNIFPNPPPIRQPSISTENAGCLANEIL